MSIARRLLEKKRKKKTPGGPITDMGAWMMLEPAAAEAKIRSTLEATDGDIRKAAKQLDMSSRNLYHITSNSESLSRLLDTLRTKRAEVRADESIMMRIYTRLLLESMRRTD